MITHDISDELWREYVYVGGTYRIEAPVKLHIKEGGTGHCIEDAQGICHWVPVNLWYALRWESKKGVTF